MAAPGSNFAYYKDQIAALPPGPGEADLRDGRFRLCVNGPVEVHYAPFDGFNPEARVVLVGITPGWTQMQQAFTTARAALAAGAEDDEVLRAVKADASFKGMRAALVRYLDGIGLPAALGIESTEALFSSRRDLLHTTSILRYPVFVNAKNYSGTKPRMFDVEFLRDQVEGLFAPEMDAIPDALIVPLGKAVDEGVATLARSGRLDPARVLTGFPHPSGANAGGPAQFRRNRDALAAQVARWSGLPAASHQVASQPAPTPTGGEHASQRSGPS